MMPETMYIKFRIIMVGNVTQYKLMQIAWQPNSYHMMTGHTNQSTHPFLIVLHKHKACQYHPQVKIAQQAITHSFRFQ
jgi:hypothetical protein